MTEQERKEHRRDYMRRYYDANREKLIVRAKQRYHDTDPDERRERAMRYREANSEETRERARSYYRANREKVLERIRLNREADPEMARERERQWARDNPEKVSEHAVRGRAAYREKAKRTTRRYREANPETIRASASRRLIRRRGAFIEDVDRTVLYERDEGHCGICYGQVDPNDFHVDHVIPLALGGTHSYDNTQLAHPLCNLAKGAKAA